MKKQQKFLLFLVSEFGDTFIFDDYGKELKLSKERIRQLLVKLLEQGLIERVSWKKGFRITPTGRLQLNSKN